MWTDRIVCLLVSSFCELLCTKLWREIRTKTLSYAFHMTDILAYMHVKVCEWVSEWWHDICTNCISCTLNGTVYNDHFSKVVSHFHPTFTSSSLVTRCVSLLFDCRMHFGFLFVTNKRKHAAKRKLKSKEIPNKKRKIIEENMSWG